ncbi:MAG: hypothetical protein WAM82_05350 [Thermoanaerobaculia bacterium]
MKTRLAPSLLLAAALFVPLPSRASGAIDIAAARALPPGTVVTVKGSVTVPSGAFSSSTFDEGFAIQDRTGGIFVSIATDLHLTVRREVVVTGTLADNGEGVLNVVVAGPGDVKVEGRGPRVEPRFVSTASVSEATESLLLQVVGTITGPIVPDPPFGTILMLDDGSGPIRIFVCTSTGIDLSGLATGQRLSVTGLGYQFGDYEVDPRFQSDIRRRED